MKPQIETRNETKRMDVYCHYHSLFKVSNVCTWRNMFRAIMGITRRQVFCVFDNTKWFCMCIYRDMDKTIATIYFCNGHTGRTFFFTYTNLYLPSTGLIEFNFHVSPDRRYCCIDHLTFYFTPNGHVYQCPPLKMLPLHERDDFYKDVTFLHPFQFPLAIMRGCIHMRIRDVEYTLFTPLYVNLRTGSCRVACNVKPYKWKWFFHCTELDRLLHQTYIHIYKPSW
jgi:hypothetical protein